MCLGVSAGRAGQTDNVAAPDNNLWISALDIQVWLLKEFCRLGFASHHTLHFPDTLTLNFLIDPAAVSNCGTCVLRLASSVGAQMALGKLADPDVRRKLIAEVLCDPQLLAVTRDLDCFEVYAGVGSVAKAAAVLLCDGSCCC